MKFHFSSHFIIGLWINTNFGKKIVQTWNKCQCVVISTISPFHCQFMWMPRVWINKKIFKLLSTLCFTGKSTDVRPIYAGESLCLHWGVFMLMLGESICLNWGVFMLTLGKSLCLHCGGFMHTLGESLERTYVWLRWGSIYAYCTLGSLYAYTRESSCWHWGVFMLKLGSLYAYVGESMPRLGSPYAYTGEYICLH